jgi:hypothetical protein
MSTILTYSRYILLLACLLPSIFKTEAQSGKMENLPNLVMPKFKEGTVILKTGASYNAVMNYEMLDQQMLVVNNGKYFLVRDKHLVDTVIIGDRKFVPVEVGYNEVLASGKVSLYMEHKCILESKGGLVPFDTRSASGGMAGKTISYGQGGVLEQLIPCNYDVVDISEIWVGKDGNMTRFSNKKQFLKMFDEWKNELNQFIKQNDTDFQNLADISELVRYINELNK